MINIYLLPGLDGTGKLFEEFQLNSPKWAKPIIISYEHATNNSYTALIELAVSQIDQSTPHIILGESFSGPIAIELASHKNEMLISLILSASFINSPSTVSHIPVPSSFLEMAIATAPHQMLTKMFLLNGFDNQAILEKVTSVTNSVSNRVIAERLIEVQHVDATSAMKDVECPVLYLKSKHDRVVPHAAAEKVFSLNSRVSIIVIDSPHMILQCKPMESWKAITQFTKKYR